MLRQLEHDLVRRQSGRRQPVQKLRAGQLRVVRRVGLDVQEQELIRLENRHPLERLSAAQPLQGPQRVVGFRGLEERLDVLEAAAADARQRLESDDAAIDDVHDRLVDGAHQPELDHARELDRAPQALALLLPERVGERLLQRAVDDALERNAVVGLGERGSDVRAEALAHVARETTREVGLQPALDASADAGRASSASRSRPSRGGSMSSAKELPFRLGSKRRSSRRMRLLW